MVETRSAASICCSCVWPVSPYTSAIPKSRKPDAKPPSSRYFNAASWERSSCREKPLRMYSETESSSMARKMTIRLIAPASSIIPVVAARISA